MKKLKKADKKPQKKVATKVTVKYMMVVPNGATNQEDQSPIPKGTIVCITDDSGELLSGFIPYVLPLPMSIARDECESVKDFLGRITSKNV